MGFAVHFSSARAAPLTLPAFETIGTAVHDLDWVRSRYSEDPVERSRWRELVAWARSRASERTRLAENAVARFHIRLNRPDTDGCYGDVACQWVLRMESTAAEIRTWEEFSSAWTEARRVAAGYLLAVDQARPQVREAVGTPTLDGELRMRLFHDQVLRASLLNSSLDLSPSGRRLFGLIMRMQISRVDRANTEWLRRIVASSGWPLPPAVSRPASQAAWVLVLHARDDPAFRMEIISRMEAMVRASRMSAADFATRYDHILWETTGTQRYGTKGDCVNGRFVASGIQDEGHVADLRREAGLPTMEEQAQIMAAACRE